MKNIILKVILNIVFLAGYLIGQSGIIIMNPEPGSKVSGDNVLIAASLIGISNPDADNVQILFDGVDITGQSYIDTDLVTCTLENLNPGIHRVDLIIQGIATPTTWDFFTIAEEKVSAVNYSGKIKSSSSMDKVDDQTLNINKINLNFKGSLYDWLDLKANIKLTSQENELYQPRNIFGFSLSLKDNFFMQDVRINIGDTNPRISRYIIDGKRIRGLDISMRWWWWNIQFVKGQLNRAVQGPDLSNAYTYNIIQQDSDLSSSGYNPDLPETYIGLSRSSGYTFKRDLTVLRFAIGRERTLQWGINLMKAKDDTSSINPKYMNATIFYEEDESGRKVDGLDDETVYTISALGESADILDGEYWDGVGPKDNIVMSTDIGLNLFDKRFRAEAEGAVSIANNNIWGGAISKEDLDLMLDDDLDGKIAGSTDLDGFPDLAEFENIMIINTNLSPLVPIDFESIIDEAGDGSVTPMDLFNAMPSLAYRARAVANFFGNYLSIEVNRVGPEFNSLANPYLIKNKKGWSITDKIKLLQNRLMLSLSFKHQDDDMLSSVENVKSQNTLSLGINAIPGPGLPTVNFSFSSVSRDNGITDITILNQNEFFAMDPSFPDPTIFTDNRDKTIQNNYMINLNHRFFYRWNHSVSGTFVDIKKSDEFNDRYSNFIDPSMSTNVINVSLSTRYDTPLETTINFTKNSSEISTGPGEFGKQGFFNLDFGAEYPLQNNKLLAMGGISYANGSGMVDMSWLGFKGGAKWRIMDDLSLNAQGEFRSKKTNGINKNTVIARLNLEYSF